MQVEDDDMILEEESHGWEEYKDRRSGIQEKSRGTPPVDAADGSDEIGVVASSFLWHKFFLSPF